MPHVFQTYEKRRNPETGKLEFVRDARGRKIPHDLLRYVYFDHTGRKCTATGTTSRAETKEMAARRQGFENEIRDKVRPAPKSSDTPREFGEIADDPKQDTGAVAEYVAWGSSCGGIGGRPWSAEHIYKRRAYLHFWRERLGLRLVSDLEGCQPRVEAVLRERQGAGKLPSTLQRHADGLHAFVTWAVQRGYLELDPLRGLVPFPRTVKHIRRAMTVDEIAKLLAACAPARRLMYEVAFTGGLRAGELRALKVKHLDTQRGGLRLEAAWTKNRKDGFQYLPAPVVERLAEVAEGKDAEAALLEVPTLGHTSRDFEEDRKRAEIPKTAPGGKIDFHAARTAYTTFVLESGATAKEAMSLVRHATPDLTFNVYGRARTDRLAEVAQRVGKALLPGSAGEYREERLAAGAENQGGASACEGMAGAHGNRTHPTPLRTSHWL